MGSVARAVSAAMADHGVVFGEPKIDLPKLAGWKDTVVGQLTKGLAGLARQRKVQIVEGLRAGESVLLYDAGSV